LNFDVKTNNSSPFWLYAKHCESEHKNLIRGTKRENKKSHDLPREKEYKSWDFALLAKKKNLRKLLVFKALP